MTKTQSTGAHIIRFLSLMIMVLGLVACSSTPEPVIQATPEAAPVEAKPEPVVLKRDYPERYTVKKGDTLWGISERFLKDPWMWPEVWHINSNIRNPHLIYPGDVIVLHFVDGQPFLTMEGAEGGVAPKFNKSSGIKTFKLSPKIRSEALNKAITTIPREVLAPFLQRPRMATDDEIRNAPYVVSSFENHLMSGSNNRIYAKNMQGNLAGYHVVRPGQKYIDPETGDTLGYELIDLADARVIRTGEPTTLIVSKSKKEVRNGDILLPHSDKELDFQFFPRPPARDIRGSIVAVVDGLSMIGQYNIVVLNRGAEHGLESGHVLAVYQKGENARDPKGIGKVQLPDERAGIMMVFRVDQRTSYALVMEAERTIRVNDYVRNP